MMQMPEKNHGRTQMSGQIVSDSTLGHWNLIGHCDLALVIPALIPDTWNLMGGDWNLAPDSRLNLSMYGSLFVGKYRQKYRRLRTHLHRQMHLSLYLDLNPNLNLDLNLDLNLNLNLHLFPRFFQQLFASLFRSMFGALTFDF
jgi:hypothetical protein